MRSLRFCLPARNSRRAVAYALRMLGGHPAARFGALAASLGAALAVLVLVLPAFLATGLTDFRAQAAESSGELRLATHQRCRHPAHLGAIAVQPNALSHHLDILFTETGIGTVLARLSALDTGFDAGCVLRVCHDLYSHGGNGRNQKV